MADFVTKIRRLADRLDYNEVNIRDKFILTLPDSVKLEASKGDDLEESITLAQRCADICGLTTAIKEVTFRLDDTTDMKQQRKPRQRSSSGSNRGRSLSPGGRHNSPGPHRQKSPHGRHLSQRPQGRQDNRRQRDLRGISCYHCGRQGHMWKQCRVLEREMMMKQQDQRQRWGSENRQHFR